MKKLSYIGVGKVLGIVGVILGIAGLFFLDFVRDYFFKNIQFQSFYVQHIGKDGTEGIENYTDSFLEPFFEGMDIYQLYRLKWIGTAFFIVLFAVVGSFVNYLLYKDRKVVVYIFALYALLSVISISVFGIMRLLDNYEQQMRLYLMSMEIAHFLQSSLPSLLFLVSFKLYKEQQKQDAKQV